MLNQARDKLNRKDDIFHINGIHKEWSNLLIAKSCYTATYSCDQKREADGFHTTLHGRDGVCLAMQTNAFAPYGTKPLISKPCGTASMCACQIATKDKYLIPL